MTLLHFMVNQLFCLTQSAGSASQPARINWGAGGSGGGVERGRQREGDGEYKWCKRKKRELILLSLTSPQGWSEQPETSTLVRREERSGEESEGMRRKQHRWMLGGWAAE